MLISYNWLKEHVHLPPQLTAEELGDKFKLAVVEVEKVLNTGEGLAGIVVGKVLEAAKHPNADKLKVCKVDAGGAPVQVVCGGSNVAQGMLVAFAPVGVKVRWHGEGDLIELKEAVIRGEKSYGMICASTEIGLGEIFPLKDEKEILDLTGTKARPGAALAAVLNLNDSVLEIDNKSLSHRPDLWGHSGLAREAAAILNREIKELKVTKIKPGKEIELSVKVEDSKLCSRYMAVAVSGVKVIPSPAWLQNRLVSVGLNPINNIVDITNYVMLDLGQPMHAFDAARVKNSKPENLNSKTITVRCAKSGETFVALDKKEYKLMENDLVIADSDKPIAIAGVMGELDSGVSNATETIIFESANFNAVSVRKTSQRLGLRSDSAQRFEKSLDPNLCEVALQKAVALTLEICPGARAASAVADEKNFSLSVGPILCPKTLFAEKLGVDIPLKQIVNILTKLGFEVKEKKAELSVKIPTWRATKDVSLPEDLVEEVARVYGFANIPAQLPNFSIMPALFGPEKKMQRAVREVLTRELGYSEMYNYSFVSKKQIVDLGDDESRYLELDNPISKEKPFVRRNLLPNLLENVASNINRFDEVKIFEIGKVFHVDEAGARVSAKSDELLPRQDVYLTAVYAKKGKDAPYWDIRLMAEKIADELKLDFEFAGVSARPVHCWQHPQRTTWLKLGDAIVGRVYELHPAVLQKYDIPARAALFSLNLSELSALLKKFAKNVVYKQLPQYPEVKRDVAFVVDTKVVHAEVERELKTIDPLVMAVELFDVYAGKNLGADKKSMAYGLTLLNPNKTLESKEADAVMDKATKMLVKKFGAQMRA